MVMVIVMGTLIIDYIDNDGEGINIDYMVFILIKTV